MKCDHRSKFSNLSNWKEEAWKKSGLQRDSNPWPPRYRCDALPTELWSHTLGARSIYWVHIFPCSEMMWSFIRNNSYLYCGCRWKCDHRIFLFGTRLSLLIVTLTGTHVGSKRLSIQDLIPTTSIGIVESKFPMLGYTRRVKEAVHSRPHPNYINRDSGI